MHVLPWDWIYRFSESGCKLMLMALCTFFKKCIDKKKTLTMLETVGREINSLIKKNKYLVVGKYHIFSTKSNTYPIFTKLDNVDTIIYCFEINV